MTPRAAGSCSIGAPLGMAGFWPNQPLTAGPETPTRLASSIWSIPDSRNASWNRRRKASGEDGPGPPLDGFGKVSKLAEVLGWLLTKDVAMTAPDVQEQEAPRRPICLQFMADLGMDEWVNRRARELDKSRSEFLYEIVASAKAQDEAA